MLSLKCKYVIRNDVKQNWDNINPVLLKGEIGWESDTGNFKIGDGVTKWSDLDYYISSISNTDIDNIE